MAIRQLWQLIKGTSKDSKNIVSFNGVSPQWLAHTYQHEFAVFKVIAVKMIEDEKKADDIVGSCFTKFLREFNGKSNIFSSSADANYYLLQSIKNDCLSWLSNHCPEKVDRFSGPCMEDQELKWYYGRLRLLPFINRLPADLKEVALRVFFMRFLTDEEVCRELNIKPDDLRLKKFRVTYLLRDMGYFEID